VIWVDSAGRPARAGPGGSRPARDGSAASHLEGLRPFMQAGPPTSLSYRTWCRSPSGTATTQRKLAVEMIPTGTPQSGIFALGTASHALPRVRPSGRGNRGGVRARRGRAARAPDHDGRREPRRRVPPGAVAERRARGGAAGPRGVRSRDVVGTGGFVMPATQHDAVLWISGSAYDVVFDVAREGDRHAPPPRHGRRGDLELALPARPRPHGVHRRHREPIPHRRARGRADPGGGSGEQVGPCCSCSDGATTRRRGIPAGEAGRSR